MNARLEVVPPDPELMAGLLAKMNDEHDDEGDIDRFCREVKRFFCGDATRLTEQQLAAVTIVNTLAMSFMRGTPGAPELPPEIQKCADALINKSFTKRRLNALQAIESTAREMRFHAGCLVGGSDGLDVSSAKRLVQLLDASSFMPEDPEHDCDFTVLFDDLPDLVSKLKVCDTSAKGKRGKKSAARVLAELIVDANGGFGFAVNGTKSDESEIERIRKQLDADLRADDSKSAPTKRRKRRSAESPKQHKRR